MTKKKEDIGRRRRGEVMGKALELAARPHGLTNAELRDLFCLKDSNAGARLGNWVRTGQMFLATVPGLKNHYFATAAAAAVWKTVAVRPVAKLTPIGEKVREVRKIGRGPSLLLEGSTPYIKRAQPTPAGVLVKKAKAVDVVTPDDVKRTVRLMPEFDARYQIDPATKVIGGFATMGIGRYIA